MDDYSAFNTGPDSNLLTVLVQLADELQAAEQEVVAAEEALQTAKNIVSEIATMRIPAVTDGLEGKFDLGDGRTLLVKEEIRASVAGDRLHPAVQWLDDNGYGHIVKRQLIFEFGRQDDEKVKRFKEIMAPIIRENGLVMKEKFSVHPQTLVAFVKEKLGEGVDLPKELLGIFRQQTAKVKD